MSFFSSAAQGALYAICSGLCYSLIGYFGINIINDGLSIYNMLFWRFVIALLFMIIIIIPKFDNLFSQTTENMKVIFYGMAFYSTSSIFYFIASKYIGTGLAMVIFFTYPIFVMLFNFIVYKAKISKNHYCAFSMIIIGMIFLTDLHEFKFDILGIGISLLSAVCYTAYILVSKKSTSFPMISTLMVSIGCAITCLILSFLDNSFSIPCTLNIWTNIIGIGIICTALPILLLLQGLKYISSEKASILSVLEPVFVIIFGITLLHEKISILQIIGTGTILSGALLSLFRGKV